MRVRNCLLLVAAWLSLISESVAQQPSGAIRNEGTCRLSQGEYEAITRLYQQGNWRGLQEATRPVIDTCDFGPNVRPDLSRDYVSVIVLGQDLSREPEEVEFLVHEPIGEPYRFTVPGLRQDDSRHFYELFIAPGAGYDFSVRYAIERVADPVATQTAAFLKKVLEPGLFAASRGDVRSATATRTAVPAVLLEVSLPFDRAKVTAEHVVTGPGIKKDAPLKTTVTYQNTPLRRWTLGLLAGALAGTKAANRARVEANVLSPDQLPTTLTMAIINVHPHAYDEDLPQMSVAERVRLFGGFVLTPGFGAGAGIGLGIVRGFGINVGGAVFLTRRLKNGDSFGLVPRDPAHPTRLGIGYALVVGISYGLR